MKNVEKTSKSRIPIIASGAKALTRGVMAAVSGAKALVMGRDAAFGGAKAALSCVKQSVMDTKTAITGAWQRPVRAVGNSMWLTVALVAVCAGMMTANSAQAASVGLGDEKADLQAYYNNVAERYALMTDSAYDDVAFDQEQRTALKDALDKAQAVLTTGTGDYAAALEELKTVYERVPYVEGGKKWWLISVANLKDGATFMLEPAHTQYRNRFMVAHPENQNQNAVMADDMEKSEASLWQLEATGANDAIYTDKPTYYFRHVETGLYFGVSDTITSIDQTHKRMVSDKSKAYAFCILTLDEVKDHDKISIKGYGNENAVVVQHSNADGTWFRLTRFGDYPQVYYISSSNYPTNAMWPAWNLYTGETSLNISGEMEQAIADWGNLNQPAGNTPGYYKENEVVAYTEALTKAKAINSHNTRREYRDAIDALDSAYHYALALSPIPLTDGYYRIVSADKTYAEQGRTVCVYDCGDGYLGWHTMDSTLSCNIFRVEKTEGGWNVKSLATGNYVGHAIDDNRITMDDAPTTVQTFTIHGEGQWKWSNRATKYTYYTFGEGYVGRYYSQNALNSFDDWQFQPVSKDIIDSINIVSAAKLVNHTLVVEDPSIVLGDSTNTSPVRLNWIKAQAALVGQLNIMAIDVRNAHLDSLCTSETLLSISSQPNCLLIATASQGLEGRNVVVDGHCEQLDLADEPFLCSEAFTADDAKLTISPAYATLKGGWQTVAVPFAVSSVEASENGAVAIETASQNGDIMVREYTGVDDGEIQFAKLADAQLQAYTPYALAVPGKAYGAKSLEGQTLTFFGHGVKVLPTDSVAPVVKGNYSFMAKTNNEPVDRAWIINYAGNGFEAWTNGTPLTMRGYFTCADTALYNKGDFSFAIDTLASAKSKKFLIISGLDLSESLTGIPSSSVEENGVELVPTDGGILIPQGQPMRIKVCDMAGRTIVNTTVSGGTTIALPAGIYIVNNKKIRIK